MRAIKQIEWTFRFELFMQNKSRFSPRNRYDPCRSSERALKKSQLRKPFRLTQSEDKHSYFADIPGAEVWWLMIVYGAVIVRQTAREDDETLELFKNLVIGYLLRTIRSASSRRRCRRFRGGGHYRSCCLVQDIRFKTF